MILRILGTLLTIILLTHAGSAHDAIGQHGGRVVDAGEYHAELVAKANTVDVFLTDQNNNAIRSAGYKGLAILVVDGKSQRIVLEPAGESRLSGKAVGALPSAPKGVVQITPPSGKTVQARFN